MSVKNNLNNNTTPHNLTCSQSSFIDILVAEYILRRKCNTSSDLLEECNEDRLHICNYDSVQMFHLYSTCSGQEKCMYPVDWSLAENCTHSLDTKGLKVSTSDIYYNCLNYGKLRFYKHLEMQTIKHHTPKHSHLQNIINTLLPYTYILVWHILHTLIVSKVGHNMSTINVIFMMMHSFELLINITIDLSQCA